MNEITNDTDAGGPFARLSDKGKALAKRGRSIQGSSWYALGEFLADAKLRLDPAEMPDLFAAMDIKKNYANQLVRLHVHYKYRMHVTAVTAPFGTARAIMRTGGEIETRALERIEAGAFVTEAEVKAAVAASKVMSLEEADDSEAALLGPLRKATDAFTAQSNALFRFRERHPALSTAARSLLLEIARAMFAAACGRMANS